MSRRLLVIAWLAAGCGEPVDTSPRDAGTEPSVAARGDLNAAVVKCVMGEGPPPADCQGLEIIEMSISMSPMMPVPANVTSVIGFTDTLTSFEIAGAEPAAFAFTDAGCSASQCTYTPGIVLSVPYQVHLQCVATDNQMHMATLIAHGAQGAMDTDAAALICLPGGATINLSAGSLAASAPVHQTSDSVPLTITNNGSAPLTFSLFLTGTEWTSMTGCVSPAVCSVAMGGGMLTLDMRFTPSAYGPRPQETLTIDSSAGMPTVALNGTGLGAILSVDFPPAPAFDLDLGTIGRGAEARRTVLLSEQGNTGIMVSATMTAPTAPFALSTNSVSLSPGGTGMFDVTCQSATAIPPTTRTIAIASTAYEANTAAITVHCEVANTQLQVTPTVFDFGEHRRGEPVPTIALRLHNPGPVMADIKFVRLASAPTALELSAFPAGGLAVDGNLDGTLSLGTDIELDVAGARLQIGVDDQVLDYPITGAIVVPKAEVVPVQLDLGTACIGTDVAGSIMMVNTGSARLTMQPPTMDEGFVPTYESPRAYPAPLLAGTSATVAVSPAMQAVGPADGALTWDVDAPGAPFTIPVHLEYIDVGTATSPARLDFGQLDVATTSLPSRVTLQNCNPTPVTITVDGVVTQRGAVDAWDLQPRFDQRTLAPHDKMTVSVAFSPRRSGVYRAQIKTDVDGEARFVDLLGEGIGALPDHTSFYACSTGGTTLGWPLAALLLVVRRRRRAAKA